MKKITFTKVFLSLLSFLLFFSCIDSKYDINDLQDEVILSQNGIILPIGNLQKWDFERYVYIEDGKLVFTENTDIFTEDFFDYFIYTYKGEEKSIGALQLSGNIHAQVFRCEANTTLEVEAIVVSANGEEIGSPLVQTAYRVTDLQQGGQKIVLEISEDEILLMKYKQAKSLLFKFTLNIDLLSLTPEDYIQLKNLKLISEGGIHI
ncbi:MAG: hypothetical protein LUG18_06495 [Candidatus Azobacteroides sp.]|nr:hypothetical protein [Candidatus Azobacteroides sp.]